MKFLFAFFLFLFSFHAPAQIHPRALDSLKKQIAAQTKARRHWQDSVLQEKKAGPKATPPVTVQEVPARKGDKTIYWVGGLLAALLLVTLVMLKKNSRKPN